MDKLPSSRVSRVESMKGRKSVGFNNQLATPKSDDQHGTSSISVNKETKLEDRLNYYHLVQLNDLFEVKRCCSIHI